MGRIIFFYPGNNEKYKLKKLWKYWILVLSSLDLPSEHGFMWHMEIRTQ